MQHFPGPSSCSSRGLPSPPARELGLTRAGGLLPSPSAPPEPGLPTWTQPRSILLPDFWTVGLRGPPAKHFSSPENRPCSSQLETPCLVLVSPFPRAGSCPTHARAHTHTCTRQHLPTKGLTPQNHMSSGLFFGSPTARPLAAPATSLSCPTPQTAQSSPTPRTKVALPIPPGLWPF